MNTKWAKKDFKNIKFKKTEIHIQGSLKYLLMKSG